MAEQNHTLRVQLEAEISDYDVKINRAKSELLDLREAALKAGGGTAKMKKQIKDASNNLKLLQIQASKTRNKLKGLSRSASSKRGSGGAGAAIIEVGRGASDARFGFVGLANNAERMTELFGNLVKTSGGFKGALTKLGGAIAGPAGIVAGISILIAYGPQIFNFFKSWISGSEDAKDALDKFNESIRKTGETQSQKEIKLIQDRKKEIDDRIAQIDKLEEARKKGQKVLEAEYVTERNALRIEQFALANREKILNNQDKSTKTTKEQSKYFKDQTAEIDFQARLLGEQGENENTILKYKIDQFKELSKQKINLSDQKKLLQDIQLLEARRDTNLRNAARPGGQKIANAGLKTSTGAITNEITAPLLGEEGRTTNSRFRAQQVKYFDDIGAAASAASSLVGQFSAALAGPDASPLARAAASIIGTLGSIAVAAAVASATQSASGTGPAAIFTLPTFLAIGLGAVAAALSGTGAKTSKGGGGRKAPQINPQALMLSRLRAQVAQVAI